MRPSYESHAEWLETDGLGGFAMGPVVGPRTRRYHATLIAANAPPGERVALVRGCDVSLERPGSRLSLAAQRYLPDVLSPADARQPVDFTQEPWPRWTYALDHGLRLEHELFMPKGLPAVVLSWRILTLPGAEATLPADLSLHVRPFLAGCDFHALQRESARPLWTTEAAPECVRFHPHHGGPAVSGLANGLFGSAPYWYRQFLYTEERARGLDHADDLWSPGAWRFDLSHGEGLLILAAGTSDWNPALEHEPLAELVAGWRVRERQRRAALGARLERAADAYIVRRGAHGRTLVAGYPWFSDWGRDTFIALRGLCLATGRLDDARAILLEWAGHVSGGLLPNRFPDNAGPAEYNAVDAALWFVVAVHEYLESAEASGAPATPETCAALKDAVDAILTGYLNGTQHGIRVDTDGLLSAGEPGLQLTWMDARVEGQVITPRSGKPVEVQALWLNALGLAAAWNPAWQTHHARGLLAFRSRFWNAARGCLYDVVDVDHEPGRVDASLRPNQILAIGGLPLALLEGEAARRVVDVVEAQLLTPLGLRSLGPHEPGYVGHYGGNVAERDRAYHQGTAWPWLLGPFVEAWVRVRGAGLEVRTEARRSFFTPLLRHLDEAGLGHIAELADGDAPHAPAGCPFQAWSVGELLRLDRRVLAGNDAAPDGLGSAPADVLAASASDVSTP